MKISQKRTYLALVSAMALSISVAANAAGDADKRTTANSAAANANPPANTMVKGTANQAASLHQMRASELIGKNVVNNKGDGLGEIKDLVVDTTSGKVQYAVISFGGFLGMGDKLFAYPLEKFERMGERGRLVLNVDKEKMKAAPGFDDKSWPNFTTATYRGDVDKFYGTKSAPANVRFARATQILKGDIKDGANKDIGDIEDMVVSLPSGRVSYVVLEFDRAWNPDNKLIAMPMKALKSEDGDGTDLVYTASRVQLKGAPSFEKSKWPDLSDTKFRADVNRYEQGWSNQPAARSTQAGERAERAVEKAGDKVERAGDKVERAVDRATTPAVKQ